MASLTNTYLGEATSRDVHRAQALPYSSNLTAAYIPAQLLHSAEKTDLLAVELLIKKPPVNLDLLTRLEEDIENHFEYRIQSFFQQLLLIRKTNISFEFYKRADSQIGSTSDTKSIAPREELKGRYAAAHSSTLPCLRIYDPNNRGNTSVVFGFESYFYNTWNSTICLPEQVNLIDSALDKTSDSLNERYSFRYRAIVILNAVSSGYKTPKEGLELFLTAAITYLDKLQSRKETPEEQSILTTYQRVANWYQKSIARSDWVLLNLAYNTNPDLEVVYAQAQEAMHSLLIREMSGRKPEIVVLSLSPSQNPAKYRSAIEAFFLQSFTRGKLNSKTAEEYVATCLKTDGIRARTLQYLAGISSENSLISELNLVMTIKQSKMASKIKFSASLSAVYQSILGKLRDQYKMTEPRNMHAIVLKLIRDVSLLTI